MTGIVYQDGRSQAVGTLPVAERLRPSIDNWCLASAERGAAVVLELLPTPDVTGAGPWAWFAITSLMALGDAWLLPIAGEA